MPKSKIKVCVISEYAYPVLKGYEKRMGGAEIQMISISNELIKRKYDVSFVTFGKSDFLFEKIGGIKSYIPYDLKGSGYSHIYPWNLYKLWKILAKVNADIYLQRSGTVLTGNIAFFVKKLGKVFVFSASSDYNVSSHLKLKTFSDLKNIIYIYGVKSSDCVICQSNHQMKLLMKSIGKNGQVIKNIYFPQSFQKEGNNCSKLVTWVGRIQEGKRPELFIKLAEILSDFKFQMIGAPYEEGLEYYEKIKKSAHCVNNLDFLGFIPHEKIHEYYSKSAILVCTSLAEGFPNTFLEAWGNCIPVVSFGIDPDEIISTYKLGLYSNNFEDLVKNTLFLLENDSIREEMGNNGFRYVSGNHSAEEIIGMYEDLFKSLLTN